jgi:tetratricopeptide (TPR) repeat protein
VLYRYFFVLVIGLLYSFQGYAQNTLIESSPQERQFNSGLELLNRDKFSAARNTFENFVATYQDNESIQIADAHYYIAYCALNLFNPDAEDLFTKFLEKYSWHSKAALAYFELGSFFYNSKKYQKTIDYLLLAEQNRLTKEQQIDLNFKLGYAYFSQKQFEKALDLFNQIKNKDHTYTYAASYYAGYLELKDGKYQEALVDLQRAEKNEAYSAVVPFLIANVYYQMDENDKLISYAEAVVKRNDIKEKSELYLLIAEAQFLKSNFEKAVEFFENYAEAEKGKMAPALQYRLAYSLYQTDKYEKATQNFTPIAGTNDALGQISSYYLGLSYLKLGNKQYALIALQQASKAEFSKQIQEEALFNYAKVNAELNNFNEAIATLKLYNRNFPGSKHASEVDELLGEAFLKTSNYTEAINYIESLKNRSLRLNTAYQRITFYKGVENFNNNDFKGALDLFNRSTQFPLDKDIFIAANYWRGESYSVLKDYENAVNSYSKVFQNTNAKNEFHLKTRYGIAYAYYNQKRYDKALEHYKAYIEGTESLSAKMYYDDAILRLADIYTYNKKFDNAIALYDKAIATRNPDLDYAYYKKGVILPLQGKNEEALENFNKVISSYPFSLYVDDALYGKAEIIFTSGKFQESVGIFTKLIDTYPGSPYIPNALNFRAIANINLNNNEKAVQDFKRIIYEYPTHPIAVEALSGIQDALSASDNSEDFNRYRDEFVKNNPTNTSLINIDFEAAKSYYNNQKYDRAIKALKEYRQKYPESPNNGNAGYFLAESYLKSNQSELAIEEFKLVIADKNSEYINRSVLRLADIYYKTQKYEFAKEYYLKLLSNSNNPKERSISWTSLMETYYSLKSYDSVKYYGDLLIEQSKYSLDVNKAYLYQGKVAYQKGEFEKATDYFITTINLAKDINAAEAKYMIAKILYDQKKYDQSLEVLYELNNSFYNYEDWLAESFLLIADNFLATEETFQAKATLQSIIDKSTHQPSIEKARVKLSEIQEMEKKQEGSNE